MEQVGPSSNPAHWFAALRGGNNDLLMDLSFREPPGVVFFEIMSYINGLYLAAVRSGTLTHAVLAEVGRVSGVLDGLRFTLGPRQREIDLGLLRWMRRASALSVVVGAGATIDAGGPSWAALVRQLLDVALTKGHEITDMVRTPDSTDDHVTMERRVIDVKHLDSQQTMLARHVLGLIDAGTADTENLMLGAQLCYDLFGQHLFMHLTGILYEHNRQPGSIHAAIAELADFQPVPDRGPGLFPGWDCIITYNFEDFLGEALDTRGFGRVAWALRGDELAGDPNEIARNAGQDSDYLNIYHLHGYTPRRLFLITQVRFIFSTAQYLREYQNRRNGIIDKVFYEYLANPVHYALYVGCSFDDEAMNDLLHNAAAQLPGRQHYALLRWPGPKPYLQSGMDEIETVAGRYVDMGVRPVWFDDFDEIPSLIRQLK